MKSTIIILTLIGTFLQLSAQKKSTDILPSNLNEAYSSISIHDKQVLKNIGAEAYQVADIKIRSSPGAGIVIGVDKNGDKEFDEFLGLQSNKNYKLKKALKAEIVFLRNILIVRPIKGKKRPYVFALSDFQKAEQIIGLLPKSLIAKAKNYFGYGISYHSGETSFKDLLNN